MDTRSITNQMVDYKSQGSMSIEQSDSSISSCSMQSMQSQISNNQYQSSNSLQQNSLKDKNQQQLQSNSIQQSVKNYNYKIDENFKVNIRSQKSLIRLSQQNDQYMPVMISINAKDIPTECQLDYHTPIDLICIIDKSGSMNGEKLNLVKKTLLKLLLVLTSNDRLCLIQFDTQGLTLVPLLNVNQSNKSKFEQAINQISASKGTDINAGLNLAFEEIQNRINANPITSIFLLTDGQDYQALQKLQNTLKSNPNLKSINFTLNTFGYGLDHDADMLNQISKIKDGEFSYIEDIKCVDDAFAGTLGSIFSVVAKDVYLQVQIQKQMPLEDLSIDTVYGDQWQKHIKDQGKYLIRIPLMLCGTSKNYILKLKIPKINKTLSDQEKQQLVLKVKMQATGLDNKIIKSDTNLTLKFLNPDEQLIDKDINDGEVMEHFYRVKVAEVIGKAQKYAKKGNQVQGIDEIELLSKDILSDQFIQSESEQIQNLLNDLNLAKNCIQQDEYSSNQTQQVLLTTLQQSHNTQTPQRFYSNSVGQSLTNQYENSIQKSLTNYMKSQNI